MDEFTFYIAKVVDFLNIKLFVIQNEPITISKVAISLLILSFTPYVSRKITNYLSSRILSRVITNHSSVYTLETLIFYTLITFFALIALRIAHIPLIVFNVIGGALAIGIGFGSKEIMSNFISGIIILFEKPIKVGDFLKIEDKFGRVSSIGMRSTKLSTIGNKDLVVPNSKFLENSIDNWSYHDNIIRSNFKVGVSYGSDIDKVESVIKLCIESHPEVIKSREVKVFLRDFGDSSLDFEGNYFLYIKKPLDEIEVASDIRKTVFKEFKKNNISIPFPQRDVHLFNQ